MTSDFGGYKLDGIKLYNRSGKQLGSLDIESLECPYCKKLLREPRQLIGCGHRYCKSCIDKIVKKNPPICPEDDEPIEDGEVRVDRGCLKELKSLTATCPGGKNGCPWRGTLDDLFEDHISKCHYVPISCPQGCGQLVTRDQLNDHMYACPNKPDTCEYCDQVVPASLKEDHFAECDYYPENCRFCNKLVPRAKLAIHEKSECFEIKATCSFDGCHFKGKIGELNIHYGEHMHELVSQMNSMLSTIKQLVNDNAKLQKTVIIVENKLIDSHEKVDSLQKELDASKKKVNELKDEVSSLRVQVSEMPILHQMIDNLKQEVAVRSKDYEMDSGLGLTTRSSIGLDGKGNQRFGDGAYNSRSSGSSGYPSSGHSSLGSSMFRGAEDMQRVVRTLQQEVDVMKPVVEEIKLSVTRFQSQLVGYIDTVQTVQESVTRHAVAMEEIKLRQDILDVKTTHGIFIWKIPEIARRYRDAQERRTLSLYSPPFHTSPHGYRMCIRAYLNGDGSGKGSHISVFFVLMKSEHDNLLSWPFRRPVTFQLLNQENQANISETFMPDTQSPSFQQPKSEMNIASGFPRFAKQSVLKDEAFTKGDAIFIRCKIDLTGMEKLE